MPTAPLKLDRTAPWARQPWARELFRHQEFERREAAKDAALLARIERQAAEAAMPYGPCFQPVAMHPDALREMAAENLAAFFAGPVAVGGTDPT